MQALEVYDAHDEHDSYSEYVQRWGYCPVYAVNLSATRHPLTYDGYCEQDEEWEGRMTHMDSIAVRANMAFGLWEPSEEYEVFVESGNWDLERIHPEACWYTIKATPAERLAHYRDRSPVCEFFTCEGVNVNGYWLPCTGPIWEPPHGHLHAWSFNDLFAAIESEHDDHVGDGNWCIDCNGVVR